MALWKMFKHEDTETQSYGIQLLGFRAFEPSKSLCLNFFHRVTVFIFICITVFNLFTRTMVSTLTIFNFKTLINSS